MIAVQRVVALVVAPIVFGYVIGACCTACGATFDDLEKAANQGDNDARLASCRADARAAFYVGQKSEAESLAVYDACVAKKPAGSK